MRFDKAFAFVALFSHTLYELAETDAWPANDADAVTSLSFSSGEKSFSVTSRSEEQTDADGEISSVTVYTFSGDGESFDTTDAAAPSLLDAARSLSFTSLAAFKPDGDTLAALGMEAPASLTVSYESGGTSKECTLLIGTLTESGAYCVQIDGSDCVYTMEAADVEAFSEFSASILPEASEIS